MKEIDINTWYRKDYFLFYKGFFSSLFNVSMELDATEAFHYCKKNDISFFIFCLYAFLKAANEVPQFRHRLIDDHVFDMEILAATTPIMRPDDENHQFTMVDCPYFPTFAEFYRETKKRIENANAGNAPAGDKQEGLICLNCLPWFSFNGGCHAILKPDQTMPIMNWGKLKKSADRLILPYFMQANHMFVDGYHVGDFVQHLEKNFSEFDKI